MCYLQLRLVAESLYQHRELNHLGVVSIASNVECCLGIIACSLPPLRKLFNFYYGSSHEGNYQYTGEVSSPNLPCNTSISAYTC
ncbi:hypothetical protein HZ326_14363 [Fusarium oxysporum f. sp. albedinis]|nr:hypothetical protein HZ326_14363 [Fusarium oxysporum f. sp. albedinis]